MTAIFTREGPLFRATEQAGGPWSPDMLQGRRTASRSRLHRAAAFARGTRIAS